MHQMGSQKKMTLVAATAALVLSACGGGGDSGGTTTPASNDVTLQGAAATGLAIAGGTVEAKCAAGTGTTTTQASGNYTVTITGGALPCVLKVTTGSTVLHSAIGGTGTGTVTANITPLTELVVAKATGGAPEALFTTFDAAAQASVSTANLEAAITAVAAALQGTVDLSGVNPITATLVPATTANPTGGNALDQKLDTLQAALAAAQTTLAEVTTAVATSGSSSAPVQTILQPAASSCAGFRSGNYVAINPAESDPEWAAHTFSLNASTLTATFFDNSTLTLTDNGGCSYSIAETGATTQYLVSKSGLSVGRTSYTSGTFAGKTDTSVIIPAQTILLAELAGTWNALQYSRDSTAEAFTPTRLVLTMNASGVVTSGTECDSASNCESFTNAGTFTVNTAKGGFNYSDSVEPGDTPSRAFAFKTADGSLSLFILDPNQLGMVVATKQAALSLPAVSSTPIAFWDFSIDAQGFASTLVNATTQVTSVDASAGTYTRVNQAGRNDTMKINDPVTGLRSRATNSCTLNGALFNCAGTVTLPLTGTGVTVYIGTAPSNFFGISITKP